MKNLLLSVIAINLTFISLKFLLMDIKTANASNHIQKIVICNEDATSCIEPSSRGRLKVDSRPG